MFIPSAAMSVGRVSRCGRGGGAGWAPATRRPEGSPDGSPGPKREGRPGPGRSCERTAGIGHTLHMEEGKGRFSPFYEVHLHAAACTSGSVWIYDMHLTGMGRTVEGRGRWALAVGAKRSSTCSFNPDRRGHPAVGQWEGLSYEDGEEGRR